MNLLHRTDGTKRLDGDWVKGTMAASSYEDRPMPDRERKIERLSREKTNEFLRRSSLTYLECCISLMLTHLSRDEVAAILEQEAVIVRELG